MAEKEKKDSKKDKPMTREEALEQALKQIEKAHGKGAIMRLGEAQANMNIEVISTGILPLDIALGVGGIPRGRIIEVYGPESSGKTTVTLHMIAEAQKAGGVAAFIDAEHALDPEYAKRLGVNIEELLISQPDTGEQALEIVDALVRSGAVDIIVVDSVAALVPKSEIDEDMGSSHVGLQARLMSQASDTIKQGSDSLGNRTRAKIVKNKVAPPFKTAEFDIMYGEGVSRIGSIIDMGVDLDIVDKSGAWYSYEGTRLGQGKENAKAALESKPELIAEIEGKIREQLLTIGGVGGEDTPDAVDAETEA